VRIKASELDLFIEFAFFFPSNESLLVVLLGAKPVSTFAGGALGCVDE